ncbi:hypothetical protein MHOL44478_07480 [Mycobacterium holsaticum DSM 44478]|nr:hypothetical protein [Mycolicibacterium holsaticum DSM 44478 = JCM 12374]
MKAWLRLEPLSSDRRAYSKEKTHMTETTASPDIEAVAQRVKQTSDRVLELSKENGLVWLEAYEKMLNGVLKLEEQTAKDLGQDWISTLVTAQTEVVREMSEAFLGAVKDRLK